MKKQILTIATGKKLYVDMAVNLARSFVWWNKNSGISFFIVTDHPQLIPKDLKDIVHIIPIGIEEYGKSFSSKLHLDKFAPSGQTLFIDSDCLIFGKIDFVFERFKGKKVSVVGNYITDGEWFGNIRKITKSFNVPHLPKFNGGIYYLEAGDVASKVYETARELEKRYDEIGFVRLRNHPNDEVIMALAMQLNEMEPILDDGTIMSDPQACPGGYEIDIISGKRWLINPPAPHPLHQIWYPFEKVEPLIFHFLGYYTQHYPYQREVYRLSKFLKNQLNLITEIRVRLVIEWPAILKAIVKTSCRPLYRKVFGFRKITKSERTI